MAVADNLVVEEGCNFPLGPETIKLVSVPLSDITYLIVCARCNESPVIPRDRMLCTMQPLKQQLEQTKRKGP
jgi:hypothetical protein